MKCEYSRAVRAACSTCQYTKHTVLISFSTCVPRHRTGWRADCRAATSPAAASIARYEPSTPIEEVSKPSMENAIQKFNTRLFFFPFATTAFSTYAEVDILSLLLNFCPIMRKSFSLITRIIV